MIHVLPSWLKGLRGVLLAWLLISVAMLIIMAPALHAMTGRDPDDYMRLLQVRDWLAGQSWWDVRQYRMNPPYGADMHWSRLVDLPIAASLLFFRVFFSDPVATTAAMALVPLIELLAAMLLLRRIMLALGESEVVALGAAALVPFFPVLIANFLPLRIDHHAWQGVMAMACVLSSLRRDARGAAITGLLAGVWLTISLEGLMLVAAFSGLMAWRFVWLGERALAPFLGGAATAMTLLFLLTRPLWQWAHPVTDEVSWPHIAAFAVGSVLTFVITRRPASTPILRAMALVPVALVGAAIIFAGLGKAAVNPFGAMDPVVHRWWFDHIPEGLPITAQDASTRLMLLWTLGLVIAGWMTVRVTRPATAARWSELIVLALIAALLSLLVLRTSVAAELLCIPLCAVMIACTMPRMRASRVMLVRVVGTLLCLVVLTPSLATATFNGLAQAWRAVAPGHASVAEQEDMPTPTAAARCDLASLNRLPRSNLFALLDLGPEILVRTPHSVVMGSYHRNDAMIRQVIDGFSGDPRESQAIVQANHADYVVLCTKDAEGHIYATRRPDGLAARLLQNRTPDWLTPVAGFNGTLRVYRVKG